ncbi:hypothetical protein HK098_003987, partial [Nowakowskiella sp. JEL0407]
SLRVATAVLVLLIVYSIIFINTRAKMAAGESDFTITTLENVGPLLFTLIFAPLTWLLLVRAKSFFVSHSPTIKRVYYVCVAVIVLLFLVRLARVVIRFIATGTSDTDLSKSLSVIAVQINNIINIPVSIFQVALEAVFLYQFAIGLRGGKSFAEVQLSPKSFVILVSVVVEFILALITVIVAIYSYFSTSDPVFNFTTAILSAVQVANIVEFGTEIGEYLEDLRTGSSSKTSASQSAQKKYRTDGYEIELVSNPHAQWATGRSITNNNMLLSTNSQY